MQDKKVSTELFWIGALVLLSCLLIFSRGLVWLLPTVIIPLALIAIFYYFWTNRKNTKMDTNEVTNDLKLLVNNCQEELDKLDQKKLIIQNSQRELRQKLQQRNPPLEDSLKKETQGLLEKYIEQGTILAAKEEFYLDMNDRVAALMANHEWKLKLLAKKQELERLQDKHYEDVEKMESIKQDVAYSAGFFSAIKELTEGITESSSTLDIHQLKQELEKLMPK